MKFNEKLIDLRKSKNFSQEELGEKLNVARQTVSKWELGETTPEMDKLIKISEIFEISLDELVKEGAIDLNKENNNTNTQKLAGIIITILKIMGVFIIAGIALAIISTLLFSVNTKSKIEVVNSIEEVIIEE